ncbi:UNVERIFIED_CONTAM: hypothetical protein FKN15_060984 [Acipenser sinensis]
MVGKKDGSTWFCVDFRKVNAISKFDAYPMPRVDELLDRLGKARLISTLDLTKGYWQIPLTQSSKEKTAFSTPDGLFHFRTMPFGLHGAPATFQRLMDQVLAPHHQYAAAYIDDVVIFSSTWKEHIIRLSAVLQSLRGAGLTAKLGKCAFGKQETQYLGYIMGNGRVKPIASKVQALVETAIPRTKSQVRSLLGLASYYHRFIPEYATIVNPLVDLTRKAGNQKVTILGGERSCKYSGRFHCSQLRGSPLLEKSWRCVGCREEFAGYKGEAAMSKPPLAWRINSKRPEPVLFL